MKAYTRLTDHVYYLILNFADDDLKNVPEEKQRLMKEVSFVGANICVQ